MWFPSAEMPPTAVVGGILHVHLASRTDKEITFRVARSRVVRPPAVTILPHHEIFLRQKIIALRTAVHKTRLLVGVLF